MLSGTLDENPSGGVMSEHVECVAAIAAAVREEQEKAAHLRAALEKIASWDGQGYDHVICYTCAESSDIAKRALQGEHE